MPHVNVVPAALRGENYTSSSFSTDHYREGFTRYGAPYVGHLPRALQAVLNDRFSAGKIRQVIYSYSTPIAWLDGDTWIIPDVRYSATTSTKHMTHLWRLPNRRSINWDTPLDEYLRVLDGLMIYTAKGTAPGENVTS